MLAVVESIRAGAPAASVDEAARCWLELWRSSSTMESGRVDADVAQVEEAIARGEGVAEALDTADAAHPDVCRR